MQEQTAGRVPQEVGFIGLGLMGEPMAGHLLAAGYRLHVHNRTRSKADALVARGAIWHDSLAELAAASDAVFTIVGYPRDVERVYLGPGGLVQQARAGTFLCDMTTSDPALARRIAREGRARGLRVLDAPVTGGDVGARAAKLSIMVGGAVEDFEALAPLFERLGRAVHQGEAGMGQHAKLANQIAIAGIMLGVCEALAYARRAGLDTERFIDTIAKGAAGSTLLVNAGPRMLAGDFAPGFYVRHFIKDMELALAGARSFDLDARCLELARARYAELAALGHESDGTQALFRLYER